MLLFSVCYFMSKCVRDIGYCFELSNFLCGLSQSRAAILWGLQRNSINKPLALGERQGNLNRTGKYRFWHSSVENTHNCKITNDCFVKILSSRALSQILDASWYFCSLHSWDTEFRSNFHREEFGSIREWFILQLYLKTVLSSIRSFQKQPS